MGGALRGKMSDDEDTPEIEVQPFAQPLADSKLSKKLFKCIKKATKSKQVLRGVKEVVKAVRKGQKGVCVIAGNISPMDVISHLPVRPATLYAMLACSQCISRVMTLPAIYWHAWQ